MQKYNIFFSYANKTVQFLRKIKENRRFLRSERFLVKIEHTIFRRLAQNL